ncbi:MAG: hypothetical protein LUG98_00600 [Tannerellaceae bacterium]|nr:hypothetical protein [Tannerellaceae bacterium]
MKIQPYIPYQPLVHINYIEPVIEVKQRTIMGEAYLDFEAGKSVILADFRRNPAELEKILASIRQIADDPDVGINRIEITGYASPEGSWRTNETLSRNRASALKEFIRRQFPIADNLFAVGVVAEDWETLRRIVEENSGVNHPVLSATEQARILTIIDSEEAPDRKEARLRALGSTWQTLLTGYFPPLRRVKYQITYTVKDYSTEPIGVLLEKEPEQLNAYELFRVAEQYPRDSEEWHQKMEQTVKLHPESVEANINAAASYLVQGEPDKAREYLDKVGDDPRASNNWGAYYLMTGDAGKAETYFRNVISADPDGALNNLMEVEKVKEDQERQRTRGRREAK